MFANVSKSVALFPIISLICVVVGCDSTPKFHKPRIDASKAVDAVMIEFDKNLDDKIDADELEKVPGLKAALPTADKDRDGKLSKAEIGSRIASYVNDDTALMQYQFQLMLDDQPLESAQVKIVPESFLGTEVRAASGKSDKNGNVSLAIPDEKSKGVHCGLYRMEISKLDEKGKELIPNKYNSETTLGIEIASDVLLGERGQVIHLKSF